MASFKLTPLDVLIRKPYKPQWMIKGHMELNSIGMLFGAPASAKSFIAMDIAFCIAAGIDWNGNATVQGKVVYLAGEGFNGIKMRFSALGEKYQTNTSEVYLSDLPASLSDEKNTNDVYQGIIDTCPKPSLIIIDTLHRNFGAGDENSAKDFGNFLYLITTMMRKLGCAVLIVHHSGHGDSDRGRGSSSIRAAMDVEYKVTKTKDLVTMACTKAKEFKEPEPMSFNLVSKAIPACLDDGDPVESAILESTTYTAPARTASLTANDHLTLQALHNVLPKEGKLANVELVAKHPELAGRKLIHIDAWRAEAYILYDQKNGGTNKPQANQKAFSRARVKLLDFNKIVTLDKHYWLAV